MVQLSKLLAIFCARSREPDIIDGACNVKQQLPELLAMQSGSAE